MRNSNANTIRTTGTLLFNCHSHWSSFMLTVTVNVNVLRLDLAERVIYFALYVIQYINKAKW